MPATRVRAYSRYLPVEPDARRWGVHVVDMGHAETPPDYAAYPIESHPESYMFTWETGRVFDEYQVLYITRGRGVFESTPTGRVRIGAGHVFILFPGVWHRYRPARKVGWDEHWIGFDGRHARQLMKNFFSPEKPVLRVGIDDDLLRLMRSIEDQPAAVGGGHQQVIAAQALEVLARIRCLAATAEGAGRAVQAKIQRARMALFERAEGDSDLAALARGLGMSYSRFRKVFRREVGLSPRQYQIDIRINKAKEILRNAELSVTEIADRLGFSSVYYFSNLFKKKTGTSPLAWRARGR